MLNKKKTPKAGYDYENRLAFGAGMVFPRLDYDDLDKRGSSRTRTETPVISLPDVSFPGGR